MPAMIEWQREIKPGLFLLGYFHNDRFTLLLDDFLPDG